MYNLLRDGTLLGEINEKQLADTCLTLAGGGFNAGETGKRLFHTVKGQLCRDGFSNQ